jgi:C1A family cysteine protease
MKTKGARMLDEIVRTGFLVLSALILALVTVWYFRFCYQEITGRGEVVIDPFTVLDGTGKADEELGKALALMLQSRLQSLTSELEDAQSTLMAEPIATSSKDAARISNVRLFSSGPALQTDLLQPVDMKLSVAGVDVGGVFPWLQRWLSDRRTLHFSVHTVGNRVHVLGSVAPLGLKRGAIRLTIDGNDSVPTIDVIIDSLAHEILRQWLSQDPANKLELLLSSEFEALSGCLTEVAAINRRANLGRPSQEEFADVLLRVEEISNNVPDWPELGYFTAWIADKAHDDEAAAIYYNRALAKLDQKTESDLISIINIRLESLRATAEPSVVATPTTIQFDLSAEMPPVKDSGSEGSVVGLSFASALEYQIKKKTHERQPISARYIYYAARKEAGSLSAEGANLADAVTVLKRDGAVAESVWPYKAGDPSGTKPPPSVATAQRFKIANTTKISTADDIKRALTENGPVVLGILLYDSAMSSKVSKTGVLPMPAAGTSPVGGHAVVVVGYDDKKRLFKFANSWGTSWGDHGYGYLPYDYLKESALEGWTFKLAV